VATERIAEKRRSALSALAGGLAVVVVGLLAASIALTALTHDAASTGDGAGLFLPAVVLAVGTTLARKRPSNPIGWLVLATSLALALGHFVRLYAVLDFHLHDGRLPLGATSVFLADTVWPYGFVFLPITLLLFPDGLVPSRRWRAALVAYLVASGLALTALYLEEVATIRRPIRVDPVTGQSTTSAALHGAAHLGYLLGVAATVFVPVFMVACVVRLAASWRGADGDRRQQLKWLLVGAVFAVVGGLLNAFSNAALGGTTEHVLNIVSNLAVAVLPVCVGVAVLRYRLYEIDRLVSRTLSYAILTGLLAVVFLAVTLLATRVLPISSPVAVAASTLAAAALFNPLRSRVQHVVDRRFNRAHYDREAIIADFGTTLRAAADLDTVLATLQRTVGDSVEPSHLTVWLRESGRADSNRRLPAPKAGALPG
jgi:hypothetical protein